jgi:hypothetical protein
MHHLYDYLISLESLKAGYVNCMIGVDASHKGGITACSIAQESMNKETLTDPDLIKFCAETGAKGEQAIMDYNTRLFRKQWGGFLPVSINDKWEVSHG